VAQEVKGPAGEQLLAEISGAPPGNPAVFLLHGTPGTLSGPRPRGIYLHRLGIRLISYNRPGYPGSDRKKNGRIVADAAEDIEAIANHFGIDRFSVIGRSGGAPHALAAAAAECLRGRVICAAALSGLAPFRAPGLDWFDGMVESNVVAYRNAEHNLPALIATLAEHAGNVRNNDQGLLNALWPELVDRDKQAIGDIALRRIIAETHAEALSESIDGWLDDVIALGRPWGFDLSDIAVPVLLWHGAEDVFSPPTHSQWLHERIDNSELRSPPGAAHFAAVEILPEILGWVLGKVMQPAIGLERLRVNDAQQPSAAASDLNVGMAGANRRR
jgi:pimeloyl-ACP methyl ester carboxylesterase